ncbi:hypothetical protein [uncultured Sulfuricurvum sp.]|uniref:hypothetical protein n=1 Tax=uncultured Sulfuricurvum sp. TaxID=430693 RepID=UPI002636624D|nr:hypothetical protein [uncultured Sulfuricurvum sp.]
MKLIRLDEIQIRSIFEYMEAELNRYRYYREARDLLLRAKEANRIIDKLNIAKQGKALLIKLRSALTKFDHNCQFITENILTQVTYYKTLTSRP